MSHKKIEKSSHRTRAALEIPTSKSMHIFYKYTTANLAPNLHTESSLLDELDNCFIGLLKPATVFTQCSFLLWRLPAVSPLNQKSLVHRSKTSSTHQQLRRTLKLSREHRPRPLSARQATMTQKCQIWSQFRNQAISSIACLFDAYHRGH